MIKSNIKYFFKVLFTPSCWIQNNTYSREWDQLLNELIDSSDFDSIEEYDANINGIRVWTGNHPYASFTCLGVRPSRMTIFKARDKLERDIFKKIRAEMEKMK